MNRAVTLLLAALLLLTTACGQQQNTKPFVSPAMQTLPAEAEISISEPEETPSSPRIESVFTEPVEIDYIYDTSAPVQTVFYHDYIFAATVVEVGESYHPFQEPEYVEKYGLTSHAPTYTKFRLRVTEPIKGDLQAGEVIAARKWCYYDEEENAYYLHERDVMPLSGMEYLFFANKDDGTGMYVLSDAPYATFPLEPDASAFSTYPATTVFWSRQEIIDYYTAIYENEAP